MSAVNEIFAAFGSTSALAEATGFPQQTVSEWRTRQPPEIPPWRRRTVLDAVQRRKDADGQAVELSPDALAYLTSTARTPKARPAPQPVAEAA